MSEPALPAAYVIALRYAASIDGEHGCCHDEQALHAGKVWDYTCEEWTELSPACCAGMEILHGLRDEGLLPPTS